MKKLNSLFKNNTFKKVLLFFNENPYCIDTAKGISIWVGHDFCEVKKTLDELVKEGILVKHGADSISAYAYTNNKNIIKKIEEYIKKKRLRHDYEER